MIKKKSLKTVLSAPENMIKPQHIYALIKQARIREQPVIFLDSQLPGHPANHESFLAIGCEYSIEARGEEVIYKQGHSEKKYQSDPWQALREFRNLHKDWCFGYLGYDLKNWIENLQSRNPDPVGAPDMFFFVPRVLVQADLATGKTRFVKGSPGQIRDLQQQPFPDFSIGETEQSNRDEYVKKIIAAKKNIYEGNYYEINISHQIKAQFEGEPWALFQAMKYNGRVPFAAFMSFGDIDVCCASPERFLARSGERICSQPIKGTLATGVDKEMEQKKLAESPKNRAENLMTVDLVRNDLSRICLPGSVKAERLFEIQSFQTVHQMVSTVEGHVHADADSVEILRACFPMGSMTGTPKIAVMKHIDELESYKRGIYSGAVGYFSPKGNFDFNVVIRSAIIKQNKLFYSTGGAITGDSDPLEEWDETLLKARALMNTQNKLPSS